jgi:hypothetical protein
MSSIWENGDPLTTPPRWAAAAAGLVLVATAVGALAVGFMGGFERGESSHDSGPGHRVAAPTNAVDAAPLGEDPEVSLRDPNAPVERSATNTAAPAATNTATPQRPAVTEVAPRDEVRPPPPPPAPTITAPPPTPVTPPETTETPGTTGSTPGAPPSPDQAAPF